MKSNALVAVQFLCMGFLFSFARLTTFSSFPVILVIIGLGITVWSSQVMYGKNLTVSPIPKEDAKLVMDGPYAFIRHPMYLAVLVGMLGIAINIQTWLGYGIWAILFIDLLIKMRFEEKLLLEKFPEYEEYVRQTKRLLPFLW